MGSLPRGLLVRVPLTHLRSPANLLRSPAQARESRIQKGKRPNEAHLSAEPDPSPSQARLAGSHEDTWWSRGAQTPAYQGSQAARGFHTLKVAVETCDGAEGSRTGLFTPADRLLRSREFKYVLRHGRRAASRELVVLTAPAAFERDSGARRLGIITGRRVGGAVVRNRLKRRVREWFRVARGCVAPGIDVVVIARRPAADLSGRDFIAVLDRGLREALQ